MPTKTGSPTNKEMQEAINNKDLENAKAFQEELITLANKYNVQLVPVVTIIGNSITTRIEIMKKPSNSGIITPK